LSRPARRRLWGRAEARPWPGDYPAVFMPSSRAAAVRQCRASISKPILGWRHRTGRIIRGTVTIPSTSSHIGMDRTARPQLRGGKW